MDVPERDVEAQEAQVGDWSSVVPYAEVQDAEDDGQTGKSSDGAADMILTPETGYRPKPELVNDVVVAPRKLPDVRLDQVRPLRDGIIAKRLRLPPEGLILAPEIATRTENLGGFLRSNDCQRGVVVRTGPGRRNDDGEIQAMSVSPGDVIWWGPYVDIDDDPLVMITEQDIRFIEVH